MPRGPRVENEIFSFRRQQQRPGTGKLQSGQIFMNISWLFWSVPDQNGSVVTKDAKRAMISQFLGFGMDSYDMALVLVMAPVLTKVFASPAQSPAWQYLTVALFYSITMAARPVGSALFGHYADKFGRRFLLLFTIAGVGAMSLLSAFIPTREQVGAEAAFLIFGLLRLAMGIFFGGEYAVGHAFVIEHAPKDKRGGIGGFIQSGFPFGFAIASFVVLGFSLWLGEAAMQDYGWRIVFATGVLPVLVTLWIRKSLVESPEFEKAKKQGSMEKAPFMSLFKPPTIRVFLQVFFFMTGLFLTDYAIYQFIPQILKGKDKFGMVDFTLIYGTALFFAFIGYNVFGRLSDYFGRKKLMQYYCVCVVILGVPLYHILINAAINRNFRLALLGAVLAGCLKLAWGVIPAYLCERFPTKSRSVGVGFGYSAGAVLGGAGVTPLVALFHTLPFIAAVEGPSELWLSASSVLTIGAGVTFISLLFSPETRHLDLSEVGKETAASR
jgi:MHS family proline/betaine transporter-like MFS transporter